MKQKFVLKLDLHDSRQENKVVNAVSELAGVEWVTADLRDGKITVIGDDVDPVLAVSNLRSLCRHVQLVSVEEVKKDDRKDDGGSQEDKSGATHPYELTVEFLKRITNNFSKERILGHSERGVVYKGVQDNGACIAVKKIWVKQELDEEEFRKEFDNLMRFQHQNTIHFVGYCHHTKREVLPYNGNLVFAEVEEIYLCSEYLQGGSLDKHLSNEPCALVWHTCYKIIKGLCDGLHYLHEGFKYPIYHLELKPTKVLLDEDMMPKIGGFGLSRLFDSTQTHTSQAPVSRVVHMPPEYIMRGQITSKVDVYSLGIIILQIMAGTESYTKLADTSPEEFIEHVYEFWVNRMQGTILKHTSREVRTCIEIALKCVEFSRKNRPTIKEIIQKLNKIDIVECSSIHQLYRTKEFSFEFLENITNDFSEQNIVGRGGYGVIYKGVLDNGEEVAVKRLHQMLWIDDKQFKNELNNLMRAQHKNIVRLVGYCYHTSQIVAEYNGKHVCASVVERAICLEYMQGGCLDNQLSAESCTLDWDKCYKIIKGICEGLHYLHNADTPIYHLDIKPANILLDKDMVAKIGDFGLSRLFDSPQTYMTQSQDIKGTRGYMPPEYINRQKISPKFDVFSLGVIIIQIMAGKEGYFSFPYTPPKEFIKNVRENWRTKVQATMSPHASEEVRTCIEIALKCVEDDRTRRPTIAQIVNELSNIGVAKGSSISQWANKMTALKTLLLPTHFKHWLFLLVAVISMLFAWLQFCPDSWCQGIRRRT